MLKDLKLLLFFLPLMILVTALTPKKYKTAVLAIFGAIYCWCCGNQTLLWTAVSALVGWFAVRCCPRSLKGKRRFKALGWLAIDAIVQIVLLFVKPSFPLALSALQSAACMAERLRGNFRTPALPTYFSYCFSAPRQIACMPLMYSERKENAKNFRPHLEQAGSGVWHIVCGIFESTVLSVSMEKLWSMIFESESDVSALSLADKWLCGITLFFMVYFVLRSLVHVGEGILEVLGYPVEDAFHAPVFSASLREYIQNLFPPLYRFLMQLFGITEANRFSIPIAAWFVRVFAICASIGWVTEKGFGSGLLWGFLTALLLLAEHLLEQKQILSKIPKAVRCVVTNLLAIILFYSLFNTMPQTTHLGTGGFLISSGAKYALSWYWLYLPLCILCYFPIRSLLSKLLSKRKLLSKIEIIAVPAAEIAMICFSLMQLVSLYPNT